MGSGNIKDKKNVIVGLCDEGMDRAVDVGILRKIHTGVFILTEKGHKMLEHFLGEEEWADCGRN